MSDIDELSTLVRTFSDAREWGEFQSPKNLAMALAGEVGELLAELQWVRDSEAGEQLEQDAELRTKVEDEVADVFIYLLRFADVTGIDLIEAAKSKIGRNELRYPVIKSRGRSTKYTNLSLDAPDVIED
jgi:NTP pyrophosphatase (non-canonical NTP hydrolase)